MTRSNKSFIRLALALTLMTFITTQAIAPRRAQAALALSSVGIVPALIVLAAASPIIGVGIGVSVQELSHAKPRPSYLITQTIIAVLIGLVVLDDQGAPTSQMAKMSEPEMKKIGATAIQMKAFNRSLDRINGVSESIAKNIAAQNLTNASDATRLAHEQWTMAVTDGVISEKAYSALVLRAKSLESQIR
ncbi:hypothetical protein WDW37_17805 [Bdellovibrionota bacterium FG-1]